MKWLVHPAEHPGNQNYKSLKDSLSLSHLNSTAKFCLAKVMRSTAYCRLFMNIHLKPFFPDIYYGNQTQKLGIFLVSKNPSPKVRKIAFPEFAINHFPF